ncbi:MAG: hypothetical protein JXA03_08415 [Bacteroidales bacterium]|nr:hypothetical protein [Bacteroidales bacterium]
MENFENILTLNNQFEAGMMTEVLNDHGIPHAIIQTTDSMFGGIERMESGWGYLEAPEEYREKIIQFYKELKKKPGSKTV